MKRVSDETMIALCMIFVIIIGILAVVTIGAIYLDIIPVQ
jgi:hypothetical protein